MNSGSAEPQNHASLDSETGPCSAQETLQLRGALLRNSRQLLELSDSLRQQQEAFSADRQSYENQIRALEDRVNTLECENKDLENHLLQQSIDLRRYFALKCASQERDDEFRSQEERIRALEEQLAQEQHKVNQLCAALNRWRCLSIKRDICPKGSSNRSQSETCISQKCRPSRRIPVDRSKGDASSRYIEEELANLRHFKDTQEERLRKMDDMLKNELRKVRLELACALKSKDQIFKYCCLTSTANSEDTFQDIESTLRRVAEVDPSYIESCRKTM